MPNGGSEPVAGFLNVDGEYFQTLGIPLLGGRTFDGRDTLPGAGNVVIVNEALARRTFVNRDPIGQRLRVAGNWVATIVGVVGNVKYRGLDAAEELTIYGAAHTATRRSMHLIVRTTGDPLAVTPAVRRLIAAIDPEVPLARTRTLEQLMDESVARPRFRTTLLALFATVALVLAAIGLYGVMMYAVSRRTREMGIRMALGARPADVRNMVIRDGLTLAATGVALGIVCALALTQVMTNLLFGISATDPATFIGVALLLIAVALGACWLPARRAAGSDPILALRSE
jgi:putative ABC transport system permease protein